MSDRDPFEEELSNSSVVGRAGTQWAACRGPGQGQQHAWSFVAALPTPGRPRRSGNGGTHRCLDRARLPRSAIACAYVWAAAIDVAVRNARATDRVAAGIECSDSGGHQCPSNREPTGHRDPRRHERAERSFGVWLSRQVFGLPVQKRSKRRKRFSRPAKWTDARWPSGAGARWRPAADQTGNFSIHRRSVTGSTGPCVAYLVPEARHSISSSRRLFSTRCPPTERGSSSSAMW